MMAGVPCTESDSADILSLLVPVYNEPDNFPRLVEAAEAQVPQPFALTMVYDFDEDTTLPVAHGLARSRPWLKLLRNDLGPGVVNALRKGFQTIGSGPTLVVMADLSDDLTSVSRMLELFGDGYQIVCPSRYMHGGRQIGGPRLKKMMSRVAGVSLFYLAGFPTQDATNNYRLYDAALVNELGIASTGGFEVALELTAKAFRRGVKIAEIPTTWTDRTVGASRFRICQWLPRYLRWYWYALTGH